MSEKFSIPLLYHTHHSLDANADDLSFWMSWARQQGGPILELGCGTGRVLLPLAEAGYTVFGVDRDAAMLAFLRGQLGTELSRGVTLIRGDFRFFCLASRFHLILMPCNTFSTLAIPDRGGVLSQARLHLSLEGVFVMSIPNPVLLANLPEEGETEVEATFSHPTTEHPVQVVSRWERNGEKVAFHWDYDHLMPDGRVERQTLSSTHYMQSPDDVLSIFTETGFSTITTYGDYGYEPYDESTSPHLIIAAQV